MYVTRTRKPDQDATARTGKQLRGTRRWCTPRRTVAQAITKAWAELEPQRAQWKVLYVNSVLGCDRCRAVPRRAHLTIAARAAGP